MKSIMFLLLFAATILQATRPCPQQDPGKILAQVGDFLIGKYTNTKQYTANSEDHFHMQMTICGIWDSDKTEGVKWFYVEHAMYTMPDNPLRQFVWKLTAIDENTVSIEFFDVPNKKNHAATCRGDLNNSTFDPLSERDLIRQQGCSLVLQRQADGSFMGRMGGYDCQTEEGAAKFLRSEIKISKREILLRDQGFDIEGQQVWGPGELQKPYNYKKIGL